MTISRINVCSTNYFSEGFVLLWKKGEDFIAVGNRIVNNNDPRFQIIQETNGNTLVISLAEEQDAGEYVCQVSTYKPIEIKHSVKIRGKCLRGHKLRNVRTYQQHERI